MKNLIDNIKKKINLKKLACNLYLLMAGNELDASKFEVDGGHQEMQIDDKGNMVKRISREPYSDITKITERVNGEWEQYTVY